MTPLRTWARPMTGWWRKNPYYLGYLARELSSIFVTAYALTLLVGLARLAQGREQYQAWRDSLATPFSLAFHAVALAFVVYHAWTWFKVMPKTMPFVRIRGQLVPDSAIVIAGTSVAVAATVAVLLAVWWWRP